MVIHDKKLKFQTPKVNQLLNHYVEEHHPELLEEVNIKKAVYDKKTSTFTSRVENRKNKNLYFTIQYKNKKIKSTYQKDYVEGKSLLNYLKNKLEKQLPTTQDTKLEINFTKKLNQYNSYIYQALLSEEKIETLEIYEVKITTTIENFEKENLMNNINLWYMELSKKIMPKYYHFEWVNQSHITEELKIKWLNSNLITHHLEEIIAKVIQKDYSMKEKWNIEFEYTN